MERYLKSAFIIDEKILKFFKQYKYDKNSYFYNFFFNFDDFLRLNLNLTPKHFSFLKNTKFCNL